MDYKKHHDLIVERAKTRILTGYYEKHHIIPRCIGGTDNDDNIVCLTPEEHYLVHQLLTKIYPNEPKLIYASVMMTVGSGRMNNRRYGWLKKKFSMIQSKARKGKTYEEIYGVAQAERMRALRSLEATGKNNNFYNQTHSPEVRAQLSIIKKQLYKNKQNHPRYGATITDEHKAILSKTHSGKPLTIEARDKMSISRIGNKNGCGNKGKPWSAARRAAYERNKEII